MSFHFNHLGRGLRFEATCAVAIRAIAGRPAVQGTIDAPWLRRGVPHPIWGSGNLAEVRPRALRANTPGISQGAVKPGYSTGGFAVFKMR